MSLYLGCPIWSFKGWVGSFFPKGTKPADFLWEYDRRLNTVEGNTTFYATPSPEKLARWVKETPETFRFCPKLPRAISTQENWEHLDEVRFVIRQVRWLLVLVLFPTSAELPRRGSPTYKRSWKAGHARQIWRLKCVIQAGSIHRNTRS
jgi:uncharacterized protein YecE (DUF72 family)